MSAATDFGAWVRSELAARLSPRDGGDPVSVLGAGNDDLEAGRRYLDALAGSGLAIPTWPREYGGLGATPDEVATIRRELAAFAVPDLYPYLVGVELVGPTLLAHGSAEQCERWLPPIANGAEIWCQLFSEPGAGSDLAGLSTRAHADGDQWLVSGQKVWTSRGAYSRYGLLLARHDPKVPKHQGITAFGLDLRTPGVDVRPLRQMNGDAHFTEVFLDDVAVPDTDRIGAVGDGWRVALTCLSFERGAVAAGGSGGLLDIDRLIALARSRGLERDPSVRDALARLAVDMRVMSLTARRARDTARSGKPGPEGSGMKLRGSRTFRDYTNLALRLLGPEALVETEPWHTLFLTAPSLSIRGGTDEIQRNIIGERILGLGEEPRLDRTLPFDQLPALKSLGRPLTTTFRHQSRKSTSQRCIRTSNVERGAPAYHRCMPSSWCPECRSEYREGFTVCADCGVALVEALPPHADREKAHRKMVGPSLPDYDLVMVATTNAVDAELIAAQLRGADIPAAVFGVGTAGELQAIQHSEGSRVMVRRADRDEAERLVADLSATADATAPIDDDELAALADEAKGWSDPSSGAVV